MRKNIQSALLQLNYWAEHIVDPAEVERFLAKVHPVASDVPLVRFGAPHDGGYLLPDDLDGISACISPGVNVECSFDWDVAERGITVHMADASVPGPPVQHQRFQFSKLFIDTFNSENTVTLDDFCKDVTPGQDLILQMDIEGAEYRALSSASEALMNRFRIIAIEVHYLHSLLTSFGFQQITSFFDRLLRTHHVVHIHPNNAVAPVRRGDLVIPPALEFTFLRKDRARFRREPLRFPHPLDHPNVDWAPDFPLPRCWYAG